MKTENPLHPAWTEYDHAAEDTARKGLKGSIGDALPMNMTLCLCGAKVWKEDPPFQAVAPFPLSHDPHDLASAMLSAMAAGGTIHTAFPRLCAACGAEIPATEHPDTNLCGRCAQ